MAIVEWSDELETGNLEIDAQHHLFVRIIEKIDEHLRGNKDHKNIELLLNELLKYAEFHFCSEENFMILSDYPEYQDHKKEHETLLTQLRSTIFVLQHEYVDFIKLQSLLADWFISHTKTVDKSLALFLQDVKT